MFLPYHYYPGACGLGPPGDTHQSVPTAPGSSATAASPWSHSEAPAPHTPIEQLKISKYYLIYVYMHLHYCDG